MLNSNILKRVNAQINRRTKHNAGGTIPVLPESNAGLDACIAILEAIEMPEDVRQAVLWKTVGDSLASYPPQDAVNLIVAQRMLKELQDEERLHNSIEGMKRQLVQRASY